MDFSPVLIGLLATLLTILGAFFSATKSKLLDGFHNAKLGALFSKLLDGLHIKGIARTLCMCFAICGLGASCVLLGICFGFVLSAERWTHKQTTVYCMSGLQFGLGLVSCGWVLDVVLQNIFPARSSVRILAWMLAVALALAWLLFRNSSHVWLLQDMLLCGLLCAIQRIIRVPSLKMATLWLCFMFFLDVYLVFVSPLIFHKNVMMGEVTSDSTLLLLVPSFDGKFSQLGLGLVAVPGFLASYLLRYDLLSCKQPCNGYLIPSVIGYLAGLASAIVGENLMRCNQPVPMYLVPIMLTVVLLLGGIRGDLGTLWQGFSTECFSVECMRCGTVINGMPVKQKGFICHFGCIDHSQAWERADGLQPPEEIDVLLSADV